jgi:hypothetical protein
MDREPESTMTGISTVTADVFDPTLTSAFDTDHVHRIHDPRSDVGPLMVRRIATFAFLEQTQ